MQDRATELLAAGAAGDDGAYEHVRARVQALISAARDLSDTCADLADALRPLPGHEDVGGPDFGRLRAERTAALLDEAASAARGTLGLLHSAYSALERQLGRPPVGEPEAAPRGGLSTWPDAFRELPPRSFAADEVGTADCEPEANGTVRAWAGTGDKPAVEPARGSAEVDAPGAGPAAGTLTGPAGASGPGWEYGGAAVEPGRTPGGPVEDEGGAGAAGEPGDARQPAAGDGGRAAEAWMPGRPVEDVDPAWTPGRLAEDDADQTERGQEPGRLVGDDADERPADDETDQRWKSGPLTGEDAVQRPADVETPQGWEPGPLVEESADLPPADDEPQQGPGRLTEDDGDRPLADDEVEQGWTAGRLVEDDADRQSTDDETQQGPGRLTEDHADRPAADDQVGQSWTSGRRVEDHADRPAADDQAAQSWTSGRRVEDHADRPAADDQAAQSWTSGRRVEDDADRRPADDQAEHGWEAGQLGEDDRPPAADEAEPGWAPDRLVEDDDRRPADEAAPTWTPGRPVQDDDRRPADGAAPTWTPGRLVEDEGQPGRLREDGDERSAAEEVDRGWEPGQPAAAERPDRAAVTSAALAGWVAVDPDEQDAAGRAVVDREPQLPWRPPGPDDRPTRAIAAQQPPPPVLTLPVDPHSGDGPGWGGDTVSPEPRSLSLVPPVPEPLADRPDAYPPTVTDPYPHPDPWRDEASPPMPAPDAETWTAEPRTAEPRTAEPRSTWQPVPGLSSRPVWAAEVVPGASAAGDGMPVYPLDTVDVPDAADVPGDADVPLGQAASSAAVPAGPMEDPGAAVIARQVEAARRHLQAALVVANQPGAAPRLGALLTAVERVLTAVTDLARETRGVLESGLTDRTFPGEARFLCAPPWERAELVGRDAYGDDVASPAGLARLLRSLGYEANSVTSAGGVAGVQVRSDRYAAHVALVEPAGGGRQRWSGALEWTDATGASRTWAETLGPVELEDEELARRVDELLRRCVGPSR